MTEAEMVAQNELIDRVRQAVGAIPVDVLKRQLSLWFDWHWLERDGVTYCRWWMDDGSESEPPCPWAGLGTDHPAVFFPYEGSYRIWKLMTDLNPERLLAAIESLEALAFKALHG
jgi:hypothetical protein